MEATENDYKEALSYIFGISDKKTDSNNWTNKHYIKKIPDNPNDEEPQKQYDCCDKNRLDDWYRPIGINFNKD